ncbi:putative ABC transporter-binding protein [Reticulibacter mediterranei]|uniref:Putative ABC transporter-binding protein n=1 Tax=Reticulibacter mediterranei TaxID=2778369 RepID=A0A8J3IDX2_9CHLR|nr:ABC transporter substrate-binding protein [Reticulibacter mediterranei]GHO93599.1 putative ABC transporter-binding protein [Reticulibacter mediterranei]
MFSEQRTEMEESIRKIRNGRINRRTFLERVGAVGLSSAAALSLLEACGGSSNSTGGTGSSTSLVWLSEQDATGTYVALVNEFNQSIGKQKGIHVTSQQVVSTDDLLARYNNMLRARSASADVMSIDIVYPAQFAASQWTVPITEAQWPTSEREKYLPGPIQGCTYQGKLWAAPLRTDLGVMYYRKDLISQAPATWDDLVKSAKAASPSKIKYGYVWQGAQYEGLVCDFVEVLYGYNGSILDPNDSTKVTVNSPEANQALTEMVSWIGTISPPAVTTYKEEPARTVWQNGDAAFMRNWPYAYALGNDPKQSKVADKFDITSLPYGGSGTVGHSTIGGWNLATNAYSKNADACWEFIKFMLQPEAQKKLALNASLTGALQSIYSDSDVLAKQPLFSKLGPILKNALPRPVSPQYSDVSDVIQRNVYQALKKQVSVSAALSNLEKDLQAAIKK